MCGHVSPGWSVSARRPRPRGDDLAFGTAGPSIPSAAGCAFCFFLYDSWLAVRGDFDVCRGYFRTGKGTAPGLLGLQYHIFLASMAVVMLADDAYLFMVAWETMALASYFLVTWRHRLPEIRLAGFLYLLMAHLGAVCILLSFGVMQGGSW